MSLTLLGKARAESGRLRQENAHLRAVLEECADFFGDRACRQDDGMGASVPNPEMEMLRTVTEALGYKP